VTVRCFDGEAYSENLTLNVGIDNPVDAPPQVAVLSPLSGQTVPPGDLLVRGTAQDVDGQVTKVKLLIQGYPLWQLATAGAADWSTWSFALNVSRWAGQNVTIGAKALDGIGASPIVNVTFKVEPLQGPPQKNPIKEKEEAQNMTLWWGLLIIVILAVMLALFLVIRNRRRRNEDAQRKRKEEEAAERKAKERAAALAAQLTIATPSYGGGYAPAPAPLPVLPPPPPPSSFGPPPAEEYAPGGPYGPQAPPTQYPLQMAGGQDVLLLPPGMPEGPAPALTSMPMGTQPLMEVSCYNCGGKVPVFTAQRPTSIQCPACGAMGEI